MSIIRFSSEESLVVGVVKDMGRLYSSRVSIKNVKKAKGTVYVEGFELRAIESRAIITFYLLWYFHDGSGRKHMVNLLF